MEPTKTNSDTSKNSTSLSSGGRFANKKLLVYILSFAVIGGAILLIKSFAAGLPYKQVAFTDDPHWKASNNQPATSQNCTTRTSSFGWDNKKLTKGGTVGGTITSTVAWQSYYAADLGSTKDLGNNLTASGKLSVDSSNSQGNFYLGYFNKSASMGTPPRAFLGMFYSNKTFTLLLSTYDNINERVTLTPTTKTDAAAKNFKQYDWSLAYHPDNGAGNHGQLSLTINGKTVTKDLRTETRADTAHFNRFGLLNDMNDLTAKSTVAYIDDVNLDGTSYAFETDPSWDGNNNKMSGAADCLVRGRNNYGWSGNTSYAIGDQGEIGGISWRSGQASSYADQIDSIGLNNQIYGSGKLNLKQIAQNGKIYLGWFNSQNASSSDTALRNFMGLQLGSSADLGNRLTPLYRDSTGGGQTFGASGWGNPSDGIKVPEGGSSQTWYYCYVPAINAAGDGRLTFGVNGGSKVVLPIPAAAKTKSASFDRFGLLEPSGTGDYVNFYMDDLRYTSAPSDSGPTDKCGDVDTVAPSISFTAPAANSYVSGSNYMVKVNANDNLGVVGVQFKLDGQNLGAEDITAPYEVSWDTTKAKDGVHKLTAVARDAIGNKTSVDVSTTVDNVAPKVSLTAPNANQEVSGNPVTLSATASDAVKLAGVQFKLDNVNLGAEQTAAPFTIPWDSNTVVDGAHKLTAVARDAAGNTTTTDVLNFVVHNDKTPPTVMITSPEDGSFVNGSTLKLSADATDNKAVAGVQFILDNKNFKDEDLAAPYELSLDLSNISEDRHTVSAVARDGWGNKATADKVTFTYDNTAPSVRIYSPRNTSKVHGVFYIRVAADDDNGVIGVQLYIDGRKVKAEDRSEPFEIKWDSRTVDNGRHSITAIGRDAAGNTTTATRVKVTVEN